MKNNTTVNTVSKTITFILIAAIVIGTYLYGVPYIITLLLQVWGITIPFYNMQLTCASFYGLYFAFAPFRHKPANHS